MNSFLPVFIFKNQTQCSSYGIYTDSKQFFYQSLFCIPDKLQPQLMIQDVLTNLGSD